MAGWKISSTFLWLLFISYPMDCKTVSKVNGNLRIATFFNPLGRIKNLPNSSKGLIEKELLKILSEKLNFTYTIFAPNDEVLQFGFPGNGTWSGALGRLARNEADATISFGPVSHVRFLAFDFTVGILTENVVLTIPYPERKFDSRGLISSYTSESWICFIATTILVTLVLWLIGRSNEMNGKFDGGLLTLYILSVILSQGGNFARKSLAFRMTLAPLLLAMIVLSYAYNGSLIARLTAPKTKLLINSIEDATNNKNIRPMVVKESSTQEEFTLSPLPNYQEIVKRWQEDSHLLLRDSNIIVDSIVNQPNHIYIGGEVNARGNIEKDRKATGKCRATILPDRLFARTNCLFLQKNSQWTNAFNIELLRLQQSGLMRQLEEKFSSTSPACSISSLQIRSTLPVPLKLNQLVAAFYVLAAGGCIAFFCFLIGILFHGRKKIRTVLFKESDNSN